MLSRNCVYYIYKSETGIGAMRVTINYDSY